MPEVSVIIVCMGDPRRHLYGCLDSILAHTALECEFLVTAYRMPAELREELAGRYPFVKITVNDAVAGFSENNNLSLEKATGEYCFIVNDDTLIEADVIGALVKDMEKLGPGVAAVQPKIVFPDGRVQTCGRDPWTPWRYVRHYLHCVDEARPGPFSMKEGLFRSYTLNGACFLARREAFCKAGWFDPRYFFTPEDIALGHRFNELGYEVWADADVSITHKAGGSSSAMEPAIKPARVAGALLFYGHRIPLGCFIWCFEALRCLRHIFHRDSTEYKTARNVMRTVFSGKTPKEVFISCGGVPEARK